MAVCPQLCVHTIFDNHLREFVANYRHLDSRRVSGWFRTARCVPDPWDPRDPGDPGLGTNLLDFETPIEVKRFVISNERPLTHFSVSTFKNTRFLITVSSQRPKTLDC